MRSQQIQLAARPTQTLTADHFRLVEGEVPPVAAGTVLVRNTAMQLTAAMAELMRGRELPMPPYLLGQPLWGAAVGVVLESKSPLFSPGDMVQSMQGWRSHHVTLAAALWRVPTEHFPRPEVLLCQGPTAYHGVVDIAQVGPGDTVLVTGAAGGVGSLAGQIARLRGAQRVVGTAGSAAKVAWLVREMGFDAAFNYRDPGLDAWLTEQFPQGFSVFFDTVGGRAFELAMRHAAQDARFALCGTLAEQFAEDGSDQHPRFDIMTGIRKQLRILPFSTFHTPEQIHAWTTHYARWLAEGTIHFPHTAVPGGLAAAPEALIALTQSSYRGNVLIELG